MTIQFWHFEVFIHSLIGLHKLETIVVMPNEQWFLERDFQIEALLSTVYSLLMNIQLLFIQTIYAVNANFEEALRVAMGGNFAINDYIVNAFTDRC